MVDRVNIQHDLEPSDRNALPSGVDYKWFDQRFQCLLERLVALEDIVSHTDQSNSIDREYYSVEEFATLVDRSKYTVREWCRFSRINAEKCDAGRGDAKNWKIPIEELQRYRDHGLLPVDI